MVAVQREDDGLWMHEVIVEGDSTGPQQMVTQGEGNEDGQANHRQHKSTYGRYQ